MPVSRTETPARKAIAPSMANGVYRLFERADPGTGLPLPSPSQTHSHAPERPAAQTIPGRRGITAFLILSFGLAWVPLFICQSYGASPDSLLKYQLALLPMALAPAAAACIVRKWITREGFADAGWRVNLRHWPYYLAGVLLPFGVVATIVGLSQLLGTAEADFSLHRGLAGVAAQLHQPAPPRLPNLLVILVPQLIVQSVLVTPLLWGEEFGWRGYLQPRLSPGRPLLAALYTGLIWGVWHYPVLLQGYVFRGYPALGLIVFPVSTVLLAIIFGWLRQKTGSIWPCSFAHAATNAIGGSLTLLLFWGGAHSILVSYLGIYGWLPLGLFCGGLFLTGQLSQSRRTTRG